MNWQLTNDKTHGRTTWQTGNHDKHDRQEQGTRPTPLNVQKQL